MENLASDTERRRRLLLDTLQKSLDETVLGLRMYEKAVALVDDDPSTSAMLHKHILEMVAAPIVDKFHHTLVVSNELKKGVEIGDNPSAVLLLSSADRSSVAKALPEPLSLKAQSLVEALEGMHVDAFIDALTDLAQESGLLVKNQDESSEKSKLDTYHKELTAQVSSETDIIAVLPKVVALLFLKVFNKAILVPEEAISAIISRLKGKISDSAFKLLTDYHKATVTLSALRAAATGAEDEDCLADRILTKEELLEEMMPKLKALALETPEN